MRKSSKITTTNEPSYDQSFTAQSKPTSNSSSIKSADSSSANSTTFEKKTTGEPVKANLHRQCYRCQGYGHFVNPCTSQVRSLLVEIPMKEENEDGIEVVVHQ